MSEERSKQARRSQAGTPLRPIPPPRTTAPDRYDALWAAQEVWRAICNQCLPAKIRTRMLLPAFGLHNGRRHAGYWHGGDRCQISLSVGLLGTANWGRVVDLVRHEAGHQLQYAWPGKGGRPHGPEFQRAYRRLGGNPQDRAASPLPAGILASVAPTESLDGAVAAIRERLAGQLSAEERTAAELKARELTARCRFKVTPDGSRADQFVAYLGEPKLNLYQYLHLVSTLLGRRCGVGRLWLAPRELIRRKEAKLLAVNGNAAQVKAACELFSTVSFEIEMAKGVCMGPLDGEGEELRLPVSAERAWAAEEAVLRFFD